MAYSIIAIIYNPNSTGSSKQLADDFKTAVHERLPKQSIELIATQHGGHAEEIAYKIAKEHANPLIIASSGDGGYNEVVNGVMRAKSMGGSATTGILPAGNANDHYHNLHSENFIDLVAQEKSRKIDLLKITGVIDGRKATRYAHSYIGVGLTPKIANELNKTKLNIIKETLLVARILFVVRPVRLRVEGKTRYYESIIFSNVDKMSKYLTISEPSGVSDGKFEVTAFKRRNKLKLIAVLLKAAVLGITQDKRVSNYSFETIDRTLVQADGEVFTLDGQCRSVVTIEKQVLTCIV